MMLIKYLAFASVAWPMYAARNYIVYKRNLLDGKLPEKLDRAIITKDFKLINTVSHRNNKFILLYQEGENIPGQVGGKCLSTKTQFLAAPYERLLPKEKFLQLDTSAKYNHSFGESYYHIEAGEVHMLIDNKDNILAISNDYEKIVSAATKSVTDTLYISFMLAGLAIFASLIS